MNVEHYLFYRNKDNFVGVRLLVEIGTGKHTPG